MRELPIVTAVEKLENATQLDPAIDKLENAVHAVVQPQAVRDVLHGVPFGHPVHPISVLIPAGAWISAAVLDAVPGSDRAARLLVGVGVASAVPAAIAGATDWSELHKQQQRVGIVHAAANLVAVGLYTASFVQRSRGKQTSGKILGYLGLAVVSGSGFLGGHLAYRQSAGANHNEDVPHRFPSGWQTLAPLAELPENEPLSQSVAGVDVLVVRRGESVSVLSNTCSHLGAPLDEGEVFTDESGSACVSCPWHGSVFELESGSVVHGPAVAPQHSFESRLVGGVVEIRLR